MIVAQRITITVPDDLHERLQHVKSKINVSQICQKAIEQEVICQEIVRPGRAIDRLRLERSQKIQQQIEENEKYWYEEGYRAAASAAEERITYDIYLELRDCYDNDILPDEIDEVDRWMCDWRTVPTREEVEEEEGEWVYELETPRCYYRDGFRAGLREYWEYLRAELEGDEEGTAEDKDSTDNS